MNKKISRGIASLDFFCIGFGAIVGVGWAVSINHWMVSSGGPLPAATGYALALIIMIPVALCYCELCPMLPVSGGGMAYAYRAFGEHIAFLSGWAALGAFITIIPWEAIYVVDITSILFPWLKSSSPLYSLAGSDIYLGHIVVGTLISLVLYLINRRGVSSSAKFQRFLCILLVGAGVLAMVCAAAKLDPNNYRPFYENLGDSFHSSYFGGAVSILASVPFFLAGFETIPQAVESSGGTAKSVGKTVVLTVSFSCVFYALLLVTVGGAMPWKSFAELDSPAVSLLFRKIYGGVFGTVLYVVILIGSLCGLLTTWNGFMMASSQMMMSMARASMINHTFAKQHPKYGTPVAALKVCLVLSVAGPFLGMGLIDPLTSFSAAGFVLSWAITAFCLIRLRRSEPQLERPYRIPGGTKTAWFAGIVMSVLLVLLFVPETPVYMGNMAVFLFVCWMTLGAMLFSVNFKERRQRSKAERSACLFARMNKPAASEKNCEKTA